MAVCDVLPQARLQWPEGVPNDLPLFNKLSDAFTSDLSIDVVCICTPNGLHANQAIAALQAGAHVVVEKPLALTVEGSRQIRSVAAKMGKQVFGVMQNRYSPASSWLKGLLDEQRLGRVLQVHLDCFWNRDHRYYTLPALHPAAAPAEPRAHPWHGNDELDGGVLFTQFAHFIDLLCWAFGKPVIHYARLANQHHLKLHRFADSGTVLYSLPDNVMGSLNFSTAIWDKNFESTLTVIGTKGTIKLGGQYMNEVRYCHVEGLEFPSLPPSLPANNYGGYTGSAANHHFVIDNVVDVLNGRAAVATPVEEGIAVVETIVSMYEAGYAPNKPPGK